MHWATFSSVATLTALLAAWHRGCATGTAFITWQISLCLLALLINYPSTKQYDKICILQQSDKYLVYNETNVIEAFQVLNFALPDLIFDVCFRLQGPCWVRTKPSALHDIIGSDVSALVPSLLLILVNERKSKSVARFCVYGEHLLREGQCLAGQGSCESGMR